MCPQISAGEMSVFKGGTGSQDRVERTPTMNVKKIFNRVKNYSIFNNIILASIHGIMSFPLWRSSYPNWCSELLIVQVFG